MDTDEPLAQVAALLAERNKIDGTLAAIVARPMTAGHLSEWIAARIFDIALEGSASTAAIDGRFHSGPLRGRTVNVKWYLKQEGVLDMSESAVLDYYLVMTGPRAGATTSRNSTRPWRINSVHLFDAAQLLAQQCARCVKVGVASSVQVSQWRAAEIYPSPHNPTLPLSSEQNELLGLFARI